MTEPTVPLEVAVWAWSRGKPVHLHTVYLGLAPHWCVCDDATRENAGWEPAFHGNKVPPMSNPAWFRDVVAGLLARHLGVCFVSASLDGTLMQCEIKDDYGRTESYGPSPELALLAAAEKAMEAVR